MEPVENLDQIRQYVEELHNCSASFAQSVPVSETFRGKVVWDGVVHIYDLVGQPESHRAYAWSSPIEGGRKRRFFAVLHMGGHHWPCRSGEGGNRG